MSLGARDLIRILIGVETAEETAARTGGHTAVLRARLGTLNPRENPLLPISADVAQGRVEFLEFPPTRFPEPFFADTAANARAALAKPLAFSVAFEDLLGAAEHPARDPSLILLHTGRSGSTLLANLLSSAAGFLALKEPEVVSDLLAGWLTMNEDVRNLLQPSIAAATRLLIAGAQQTGGGDSPQIVLKLAAWNAVAWPALTMAFPSTPLIFLHRHPEEVVRSLVAARPAWFDLIHATKDHQAVFFPTIRGEVDAIRDPVALFSHAWRSIAEAATALPPRTIFLSYDALRKTPMEMLGAILEKVPVETRTLNAARVEGVLRRYSKSTDPAEKFDVEARHHRAALGATERELVRRITGDLPESTRFH